MRNILLICALCAPLIGCSSLFSGDDDSSLYREITDLRKAGVGSMAEFRDREEAKRLYALSMFSAAARAFENLRDNYPMSTFSEFYEAKAADAQFELGRFAESAVLYQGLFESAQRSSSKPYYALRTGESYLRSYRGVGRDIQPLHSAEKYLMESFILAPSRDFALQTQKLLNETKKLQNEYVMQIAEFYEKAGNSRAAKARLSQLQELPDIGSKIEFISFSCLTEPVATIVLELKSPLSDDIIQELYTQAEEQNQLRLQVDSKATMPTVDSLCPFQIDAQVNNSADSSIAVISITDTTESSKNLRLLHLQEPPRLYIFSEDNKA